MRRSGTGPTKPALFFLVFVILVVVAPDRSPWRVSAQTRQKSIAVTFDDLPKAHGFDDIDGLRRTTDSILTVLKAHHVPAVAFVNEQKLYVGYHLMPERVDELRKWVAAGVILGNHTYSHIDINDVPLERYQNDVIKGEKTYTRLMRGHSSEKWFRHPFTHTGPTAEIKAGLNKFLATRGYRVAPFTIENSDWLFSAAYEKAKQAGDEAQAARLRDEYLSYTGKMFDWFESLARDDFGRDIPEILLVHANELHTDVLDALLTNVEKRGYGFVTLTQAMKDPAYASPEDYVGRFGPSWLHRWRVARQLPWRMVDEPDPPKWVADAAK
ncbi:MAG TPA: polysaccharide deacetylase family protein [Vicinamibacterales bacterium]